MPTEMSTEHATITLADGRRIEILAEGPEDGIPLVRHHGTPGGGLVSYPPIADTEVAHGFRSIHLARPGYSQSTPRPGRRVADAAGDVAEILDALGADTFLTIGWSGGGPHALACAALLPGRCLAAASVAGVAPRAAAGLDWLAGMAPENIDEFGAAEAGPAELTSFLEKEAAGLGAVTGASVIEGFGGLVGDADKAVLTGEYADYMAASLHASVSPSLAGWFEDDQAFVADWGFSFGADAAPVAIWQGDDDHMVPFGHGQWLAAHIPGAQAHLLPGEGHLSLSVGHYGQILDDLFTLASAAGHGEQYPGA